MIRRAVFRCLSVTLSLAVFSCTLKPESFSVSAGLDPEDKWHAELENPDIDVRYGFKLSGEKPEGMITDFYLKAHPQENIAGRLLDAVAHRGEMVGASVARDDSRIKSVRLSWGPSVESRDKYAGYDPAEAEISIYPRGAFIRIEYLSYFFPHVCDIGAPGGRGGGAVKDLSTGGTYVIYGAEEWQRLRRSVSDSALRNHENVHHRLTDELFPIYPRPLIDRGWSDENPMSYKGWYIMGVYNEENGRGYGRVFPVTDVPYIKLLWNKGFELFPFWRQPERRPCVMYLFAVDRGAEQILSLGKELVEREIS